MEQHADSEVHLSSDARTRFKWIELYQQIGDAGVVCRRCGISRPALRKWLRRFQAQGVAGLESLSRRPFNSPTRKVSSDLEHAILQIREEKGLGARRIKSELFFDYGIELSQTAIQRVLDRHDLPSLTRERRRHVHKRYNASFPGERMQMDTMKVGPRLYQYTLIDDYSRFVYADIYPHVRRRAPCCSSSTSVMRLYIPSCICKPTTALSLRLSPLSNTCCSTASSGGRLRLASHI